MVLGYETDFYTCMPIRESNSPNDLRSQIITRITTTMLNILLIFPSMGMYVLTSHRSTPTIIITSNKWNIGINKNLSFIKNNLFKWHKYG